MTFDPVEAVKFFGGLAGLLSGGFLIYDRLVRDRPIVALHRQTIGVNGYTYLRIINPIDDDLVIKSIECLPARIISVAVNHKTRSIMEATFPDYSLGPLIVAPKAETQLPIIKLTKELPTSGVRIAVKWRRTRHTWPWDRTSSLKTTGEFIKGLEEGRPVGIQGVEYD